MNGFATVMLAGNLTRDPALKYTTNGTPVCEFGIAVNEKWKDKNTNELKQEAHFFDVTCFGKTAETAGQWLAKGKPVCVEGKLRQDRWETDDGQKRSKVVVLCNRIHFLPDGNKGVDGLAAPEGDEQA